MTSINFVSHWFDSTGNRTPGLPHRKHALYWFGHHFQSYLLQHANRRLCPLNYPSCCMRYSEITGQWLSDQLLHTHSDRWALGGNKTSIINSNRTTKYRGVLHVSHVVLVLYTSGTQSIRDGYRHRNTEIDRLRLNYGQWVNKCMQYNITLRYWRRDTFIKLILYAVNITADSSFIICTILVLSTMIICMQLQLQLIASFFTYQWIVRYGWKIRDKRYYSMNKIHLAKRNSHN